jgi:hypothetical protein
MLANAEIDCAARELSDFRREDVLSNILTKYGDLLEGYRRLKSDYEEERESRERYKKLVREQERNPYAMVLVDGDGYIFQDLLVQKGSDDGGGNAARALNEAVRASLQTKGLDHCQVIVRVYADVAGVSKALYKAGLCGPEKRSLSPFIASFNRSFGHADFVDAGDLKESADFKLRALLRLHADNAQCKHIYFAACHDVGYISELTPHKGDSSRFTLIKTSGANFHQQFTKLDLGIENFPGVFRSTPLEVAMQLRSHRAGSTGNTKTATRGGGGAGGGTLAQAGKNNSAHPNTDGTQASSQGGESNGGDSNQKICRFYQQGKCKYGTGCKNAHVSDRLSSITSWRAAGSRGNTQSDGRLSAQDHDGEESPSAATGRLHFQQKNVQQHVQQNYGHLENSNDDGRIPTGPGYVDLFKLPKKESIPKGHVAVTKDDFRLDAYIPPVTVAVQTELRSQVRIRPVCNRWHLTDSCSHGDDCFYDHEPLTPTSKRALELLARSIRCQTGGKCRDNLCTKGHVCQNQQCKHYGGKDSCKLPWRSHREDLSVALFLPAIVPSQLEYETGSYDDGDSMSQFNERVDDGALVDDGAICEEHSQNSDNNSAHGKG